MTVRFGNRRIGFYIFTFALAGSVLGLGANFATVFLPNYHRDFTIFTLVASSLTILTFLLQIQWAQPQTEVVSLTLLSVIWLIAGAWSTDVIGNVQCDALQGQHIPNAKGGQASYQAFCYQMKAVQAMSWALFCAFVIALYILFQLVHLAQRFGRWHIWTDPIRELPWFGEYPGYYNTHSPGVHTGYYPPGQMPVYQPGNSIVIQPGVHGNPPTVTHIP